MSSPTLRDRLVQLAHDARVRRAVLARVDHREPQAVEETANAGDARVAEVPAFLEGAEEHQVHAERIGAPLLEVLVGDDDVALGLRHLRAVADDVTVGAEARERFLEVAGAPCRAAPS